jgi:hypothetical protein
MIETYRSYSIPRGGVVLRHLPSRPRPTFLRDLAADDPGLHLRAKIRSGDYLATVATDLERIAQSMARSHQAYTPDIERIAAELLAVAKDYTLTSK